MSDVNKTLKQYNTSLPKTDPVDKDRNFGRPPITTGKGASTKMDGWRGNSDFGNIMNGTNGVNWNNKYTKWDVNSNPGGGANKAASIFNGIAMGLGAATTGLSIFGGIKAITDSNKAAKGSSETSVTTKSDNKTEDALTNTINTAETLTEDSDPKAIERTQASLLSGANLATEKKKTALLKASEAKADAGTLRNIKLVEAEAARNEFKSGKASVMTALENLKAIPQDKRTDEQKSEINRLEKLLKNNYSDKEETKLEKAVTDIKTEITKKETMAKQYDQQANSFNTLITNANTSIEKLNKIINK